jgi:hypothetical protein
MSQLDSLSDSPVNFNDQLTNGAPVQIQPTQKLSNLGLMDFSNFENAVKFCEIISKTEMCPKGYKGKPFEVMCAIQYGHELGLSPFQAMHSIAVINGKPSIYGDGLIGLCLAFPECEDIQERFDETTMTAICKVKRKGMSEVISTYGKEDAIKAALWGKPGPWTQYQKRMLQMRARGFALRDAFADRLKGIITAEEARDYPTQEEKQLKVVTPIRKEIEIKQTPASEKTVDKLQFMVNHCKVEQPIIDKWLHKAKVDDLSKLNESQAQAVIQKLEREDSTAQRAWFLFNKSQTVYQEATKQMPHGIFTDFTPQQCETVLEGVAYA